MGRRNSRKNQHGPRVGLVYDERMCSHTTPDKQQHPENPNRIKAIWRKLQSRNIPQRCVVLSAKEAEEKYVASVHSQKHTELIRKISMKEFNSKANHTAFENNSLYFNKGSSKAAYLAAGSVIELGFAPQGSGAWFIRIVDSFTQQKFLRQSCKNKICPISDNLVSERVAKGELHSAVAIVRPPGHHAEPDEAMGFCFFNNVAIAANFLINDRPELGIQKILIVDWDVHHGNGTQTMFWEDPRVLFFSVHRYDYGRFYPTGNAGSYKMVGEGFGAGYNINVPWERGQYGDADYFAVWEHILIPVARAFNPDIILISGGFDAAAGDPLGGCRVTPYGYSVMMQKLMQFAGGRIVMALEGGYNLTALANSVLACVQTLLEDRPVVGSLKSKPYASTWRIIEAVRKKLGTFWPVLINQFPKSIVINSNRPCIVKVGLAVSMRKKG